MRRIFVILFALLVTGVACAQPVYKFTVKIGIDRETTDHLGGFDEVRKRIVKMFETINRAFINEAAGIKGRYNFVPDMDSLYVYEGSSWLEINKPHPNHDYLVVMDGFRNFPDEGHGGWFGSTLQVIGHDRGHVPGKISDPFDETATDGIIHEFGHARGIIDEYAMSVDPAKNPINGQRFQPVEGIMNYCYGVRWWSRYSANILNLTKDKIVNIDDVIAPLFPEKMGISVLDDNDKPVANAEIKVYGVRWYSSEVNDRPVWRATTDAAGRYAFPSNPFIRQKAYGFRFCNLLVEATVNGTKSYGWMPITEVQNAYFDGRDYELTIKIKRAGHGYIAPVRTRWTPNSEGGITWRVDGDTPHYDHIEMSGEQVAEVLRWGVDMSGAFTAERSLVFPTLRTVPNDTHASLMQRFAVDIVKEISVNGMALGGERVREVSINGNVVVKSTMSVGGSNIGTGSGTRRLTSVDVVREFCPTTVLRAVVERYTITNTGEKAIMVVIPQIGTTYKTDPAKGVDGAYILSVTNSNAGVYMIQPGENVATGVVIQAYRITEQPEEIDVNIAIADREAQVEAINGSLILETPSDVLNRMFAFAKLRACESIVKTKGGYMHAPGGESYYAAIWANDQAEYANPFFPFVNYEVGRASAINSFRHFARFMNPEYKPLPSSIVAEGDDIWDGAGDRGDAAMIAYGAARYALASGNLAEAQELWKLIEWCLEYCRRNLNSAGVVASDTDELEGRFPAGMANLCTSALYYDALLSAAMLGKELGVNVKNYTAQAKALRAAIERYFGSDEFGFHTYRYYEGNDKLRSWICIPLTMGIMDRAKGTVEAMFSPRLWSENGMLTEEGSRTYWDRSTLYGLRGAYAAGYADLATEYLTKFSTARLLGDHVPYTIEAFPEGSQRHLSAENALYCRVIMEGLFGIRPTGLKSFEMTVRLPKGWNEMALRRVAVFGSEFDIEVSRLAGGKIRVVAAGKSYTAKEGEKIEVRI